MPGRDGTGPLGQGSMTGRGLGNCVTSRPLATVGYGRGLGLGLGLGRGLGRGYGRGLGFGYGYNSTVAGAQDLRTQRDILQTRINETDAQLKK